MFLYHQHKYIESQLGSIFIIFLPSCVSFDQFVCFRLEKRSSILDLRMECQDLERCSIINHFAKFHGLAQTDRVGSSFNSKVAPHREFHQRKVTAFAMPGSFPDGGQCFSL